MRHHNRNRTLGRKRNVRQALLRSLARALILEGKILTTQEKAKEVRPFVEKLLTRAKSGETLRNRRLLQTNTGSPEAVSKLFQTATSKYKERQGGYTRIIKLPPRRKDAAEQAFIEFV